MAPKRGMSAEDKRKTILSIFHESKDVFVLKASGRFWSLRLKEMLRVCSFVQINEHSSAERSARVSLHGRRRSRRLEPSEAWCFKPSKTCCRCGGGMFPHAMPRMSPKASDLLHWNFVASNAMIWPQWGMGLPICSSPVFTSPCPSPQSLVDDDLVHMEKIGSSNYFW